MTCAAARVRSVRILIFHGYLLGGTGSNVYNARLAAALVRALDNPRLRGDG